MALGLFLGKMAMITGFGGRVRHVIDLLGRVVKGVPLAVTINRSCCFGLCHGKQLCWFALSPRRLLYFLAKQTPPHRAGNAALCRARVSPRSNCYPPPPHMKHDVPSVPKPSGLFLGLSRAV
jgi:hypothetical protein